MGTFLNQANWKSLAALVATVLGAIDPGHTWSAGIQALIIGIGGGVLAIDHVVSAYLEGVHTRAVTTARATAATAQATDVGQSLASAMANLTGSIPHG